MNELERRLRTVAVPDPDAEARAWRLAHAAYRRRPRPGARAARRRVPILLAVVAALAVTATATPAGTGALDLLRDVAGPQRARPAAASVPSLTSLRRVPGGGRLLVLRDHAGYVIGAGALPRRLGPATDATFSAFGRYVATASGRRLTVFAVDGRRVWSLREPAPIDGLAWAPDGLRVAYRAGGRLRVVDGNGERPRDLARADGAAVAWRPGVSPVITYQREPRVIAFTDVATGQDVARVAAPPGTFALRWSDDGGRLAVAAPRELRVYSPNGALLTRRRPAPGRTYDGVAFVPRTRRLAVVVRSGGSETLRLGERVLATAPFLVAPRFSPDGSWVVVDRGRERWSFVPVRGGRTRDVRGAAEIVGWSTPAARR